MTHVNIIMRDHLLTVTSRITELKSEEGKASYKEAKNIKELLTINNRVRRALEKALGLR